MRRSGASIARPRSSAGASNAAKTSASTGWTPCRTRGSASSARPRKKMENGADRRLFWFTTLGVVTADLITKLVAAATLLARPRPLVGDYAVLRLVYNEGAAFGISLGPASRWIFLGLALIALMVLGAMVGATK